MNFQFDEEMLIDQLANIASKECNISYDQAKMEIEKSFCEKDDDFFKPIDNVQKKASCEFDYSHIPNRFVEDWKQFIQEEDILPNLRWQSSMHPCGCKVHEKYWNRIWSIRDPFWKEHHPGDCSDCLCYLSSTDDPVTEL